MESSFKKYFELEEIAEPEQDEQAALLSEESSPEKEVPSDGSMPLLDTGTAECTSPTENAEGSPSLQEEAELASVAEDASLYTVSDGTEIMEDKPPEEINLDTE
ncbi:hypothetical protein IMSAGC009_04438 [Lachnospiraceae bacterium]|nr:hypothetical protein IMSAGC009_04438 [Lachnospiraceae bacterium]